MGCYIRVDDDVKVYVEDMNPEGSETVVFLHGWPGSHELFEYQYDYFIKKGYRCIGIDQRGFGKSDKPTEGYDYNTLSDDLKAVVDILGLDGFTLLGHSTGGAIAARYMARHKGCGVKKLILCAAAVPSLIKRPYFRYGIDRNVVENIIKQTYNDRPLMLNDFGEIFFYKKPSPYFLKWFMHLGFEASGWATAQIAETWLGEEDLFGDIKTIYVPTLILHGIYDKVCLFALAKYQHKEIKNSILIRFNNSGHAVFYDQKEKFNKTVEYFIENDNCVNKKNTLMIKKY
ncbi:MAG: alpha/beta hydrolase [Inconstantimicrobium porci]|uniref:alpha/beta fold hydrolase n=1 Tax=Inconstantimicrobium porci TaxID=2652291 RepID=UPI002A90E06B|nr:alpha/beta hydrolase [Inconstantimicrobium porci]MDY5911333.1 alpha/beta hydrolase [Inconstantimicrobium porci]